MDAVESAAEIQHRCPDGLAVVKLQLKRVLVIGSCMTTGWPGYIRSAEPGCECDFLLMNNAQRFPAALPAHHGDYDFQLIQVPLRILVFEKAFLRLDYGDVAGFEKMFATAKKRLRNFLGEAMRLNAEQGLLTFLFSFLQPQQNPMGRLLPRYDLRNFAYFVEELNRELHALAAAYRNTYVFDYNEVAANFGRKYVQDDAVYHSAHGSVLADRVDYELDQERLEQVQPMSETYPLRTRLAVAAGWAEIVAMVRTLRQADMVKMVIVDLDDTLWRGVAADAADTPGDLFAGWPLGFIEALVVLRRRGILLGIVSKNDEAATRAFWARHLAGRLELTDFVAVRINWRPKADNVREILAEVNLLDRNVVFIDDNPVERAAVVAALPGVRSFGANPYVWRRLLLWAPETQVVAVTEEGARRTEMVRAQVEREVEREGMGREEFLAGLEVRVRMGRVAAVEDGRFRRVLELLNKTNQFNTTGERWSEAGCGALFGRGGRFEVFTVVDRFTEYGLVGVLAVEGNCILQFVMSCRVAGLEVELAVLATLGQVRARLVATELNLLCRGVYAEAGFVEDGEWWVREAGSPMPAHVRVEQEGS